MNPERRQSGPVMDVQRPRPKSMPPEPTADSTAPADNIVSQTPSPGQVIGQQGITTDLHAPAKAPKDKKPGIVIGIIAAIIIVILAGGIGGFVLWTNSRTITPGVSETQSENERVNVEDIDNTVSEIDKTLNGLNDSADITPGDVSNSSLGL